MKPLAIPEGAVDTHVHTFDPARFPFAADTAYHPTPAECGRAVDLAAVLDTHGFARALLVNPKSGYGYDNRCMLEAIARGKGRFRGIARVPANVTKSRLRGLASRGIVGVRLDLVGDGLAQLDAAEFPRFLTSLADLDLRGQFLRPAAIPYMTAQDEKFIRRIAPALPFIVLVAAVLVAAYHVLFYW